MRSEVKVFFFLNNEKLCLAERSDYFRIKTKKVLFRLIIIQLTGFVPISTSFKALDKNMTMYNIIH